MLVSLLMLKAHTDGQSMKVASCVSIITCNRLFLCDMPLKQGRRLNQYRVLPLLYAIKGTNATGQWC